MSKRVLVVAAHPDDEVLGCGATLARLAREGHDCRVLIMGGGLAARTAEPSTAGLASLRQSAEAAARILGATGVEVLDFPDNRMDTVALLDVVKAVEARLHELRPHVVFTHHARDLNIDHAVTARAVETATRPVDAHCPEEVYAFEVPSSTEWAFERGAAFAPNHFIDVAASLSVKIEALKAYASEIRPFPHPRSPEAIEALARLRGSQAGLPAAEAFTLVRRIQRN